MRCCRSRHLFRIAPKETQLLDRRTTIARLLDHCDLVLWDNRCTMHPRDAFDPNSRRIMHRTQVKGDARPV
jgi:alpha-ketoglutarate-dependent taurine dioxygenase